MSIMKKLNEDTLTEQSVIEWLKETGYETKTQKQLVAPKRK